jgi:hypothetical protein
MGPRSSQSVHRKFHTSPGDAPTVCAGRHGDNSILRPAASKEPMHCRTKRLGSPRRRKGPTTRTRVQPCDFHRLPRCAGEVFRPCSRRKRAEPASHQFNPIARQRHTTPIWREQKGVGSHLLQLCFAQTRLETFERLPIPNRRAIHSYVTVVSARSRSAPRTFTRCP